MSRGLIRGEMGDHANEAAEKKIPKDSLLRLRKFIIHDKYFTIIRKTC